MTNASFFAQQQKFIAADLNSTLFQPQHQIMPNLNQWGIELDQKLTGAYQQVSKVPLTSIDQQLVQQEEVYLGDQSHLTESSIMQKDSEMIPNQESDEDTTANATSPTAVVGGGNADAIMNLEVDNQKV